MITLCNQILFEQLQIDMPNNQKIETTTIIKDITVRKRGQEMKLVLGGIEPKPESKDLKLITLLAKAHLLRSELEIQVVDPSKSLQSNTS